MCSELGGFVTNFYIQQVFVTFPVKQTNFSAMIESNFVTNKAVLRKELTASVGVSLNLFLKV